MTGAILAGGQNTRYPEKKAFIKISGEPIIDRNLRIFKTIFDQILISTNEPTDYFFARVPLIGDVYKVLGPMSGILSCLLNSKSDKIFVIACDMPFIDLELIRFIISKPDDIDAVVPIFNSKPQPLFSVYHKRLIPIFQKCIQDGHLSLKGMLKTINCEYINEEIIRKIDSQGRSFININTPKDMENVMIKYTVD